MALKESWRIRVSFGITKNIQYGIEKKVVKQYFYLFYVNSGSSTTTLLIRAFSNDLCRTTTPMVLILG